MSTSREWTTIKEYEEILFDYYNGIARITINRERYRNAFTPKLSAHFILAHTTISSKALK